MAKSPNAFRTISEAADEVGAPQHVLRFWETKFNFVTPLKRAGGRRFYRPQDVVVLKAVRRLLPERTAPVIGLRYFNVYGPGERHKARMASVAMHFFDQYRANGKVRLFAGSGGYADGEQRRDFVAVEDVVAVNLHFLGAEDASGVYNCGTGRAESFNAVAVAVINACRAAEGQSALDLSALRAAGLVEYFPMPADLERKYQSYTEADLGQLRQAGCRHAFACVEEAVPRYVEAMAGAV